MAVSVTCQIIEVHRSCLFVGIGEPFLLFGSDKNIKLDDI